MSTPDPLPGLAILENAIREMRAEGAFVKSAPQFTQREAENVRRERLHAAAIKRRRKRKKGGPK